ncbi:MAG TPA: substrate-binding domain-containing protein, partial [Pirellulales bacterium]
QISLVDDFVTKRVSGICLAPLDSQALEKSVRGAKDQGIPTVIFDSALADETNIVSYVATDNYRCGAMAARYLAELLGGKGKVILLRYTSGSESTEQREQGFLETLTKEFPNIEQLSTGQYSGTSFEDSHTVAQQLLLKYGDEVDGVFTVCEPNSTGMLRALEARGPGARDIKFIAFDPNARLIQAMRDGLVDGIVLQDPIQMGYQAVKTLLDHLEGKPTPKRVQIAEYIATPKNMDEPAMAALLKPEQSKN